MFHKGDLVECVNIERLDRTATALVLGRYYTIANTVPEHICIAGHLKEDSTMLYKYSASRFKLVPFSSGELLDKKDYKALSRQLMAAYRSA